MSVEQKRCTIVAKKTSDQLNCLYCKHISKFSGVRVQELVYLSHATKGFSGQALVDLLKQARENNAKSNVTGILLYDGRGMFMQAIEGKEKKLGNQSFVSKAPTEVVAREKESLQKLQSEVDFHTSTLEKLKTL